MSLVLIFDDGFQIFQQNRSNLELFLKILARAINYPYVLINIHSYSIYRSVFLLHLHTRNVTDNYDSMLGYYQEILPNSFSLNTSFIGLTCDNCIRQEEVLRTWGEGER